MSRPSRARGLKPLDGLTYRKLVNVAPFAGAWIETPRLIAYLQRGDCRALRGRVD